MKKFVLIVAVFLPFMCFGQLTVPNRADDLPTAESVKTQAAVEFARIDLGITICNSRAITEEKKQPIYTAFTKAYGGCFSSELTYGEFLALKSDETRRDLLRTCIEEKLFEVVFLQLKLFNIKAAVEAAQK